MRRLLIGTICLLGLSAAMGAAKTRQGLTVHEWGTFLAMAGSDGATLDGMYHEEHALPGFVHARSRDQLHMPAALMKGETPVIYFYGDQAQQVSVRVGFPSGIWTQWYPQASQVGPSLSSAALPEPRDGHINWKVLLRPATGKSDPALPPTSADALWRFARDVDADYVRPVGRDAGEWERFIFYRGLGQAPLPLKFTESGGGTLSLQPDTTGAPLDEVQHLFILKVENGKGGFRYVSRLGQGQSLTQVIPAVNALRPAATFEREIGEALEQRLVESGLYPKEARAMVRTWENSYFRTDGIRVLAVMPQAWTDRFIPMDLEPRPASLVRVMVGRLELLTSARERRAEAAIRELTSAQPKQREQAFTYLREQGRYVEPVLRRVVRTTEDDQVKALCNRLLLTGFVTELRTATRTVGSGARQQEETLNVQAQLAALLKEVGLEREARETAEPLVRRLRSTPEPSMDRSGSRHYFRALARATEALGDDPATVRAYERFVRFGSRVKQCGGCHMEEGPRDMAWFRDWWAGRRYAKYVARAGELDSRIEAQQQVLAARPNDVEAQMLLAYLYEAGGKAERAEAMWSSVTARRVAGRSGPKEAGLDQ